ncbi:hypothetical protein SAMN05660284_02831 [Formivibrio citricus]|uniref:Cyclic-phosphate processing Receiver domain-containing protein n=1 Tax=Formivibrio citricus TaxID=83765 RepID=A0A1I5E3V5_9NEIS|nr:cyclic-phosphate processing receiver domain-containing protein [Formivibrio citricus]SFO06116.1 hypothetical protein SAMN05660284_02831 [Formivibrio citricus]
MNVYLDDIRNAPDGWVCVRWPSEAIALLKTGLVKKISLDHDLGDDAIGTGYDVLLWIEEAVATNNFSPPEIVIHSANISARHKMELAIDNIKKLNNGVHMRDAICILEEMSRNGFSVIVKIDGERWGDEHPKPYTVIIFGGNMVNNQSHRFDSDNFLDAVAAAVDCYKKQNQQLE